jgi:hypothetical protein
MLMKKLFVVMGVPLPTNPLFPYRSLDPKSEMLHCEGRASNDKERSTMLGE